MSTPPQSAIPTDLLLLAARFVVRDQWLTTRVPTTWHVDQLKAWLLNKCLHIPLPPDFDRRVEQSPQSARPTSPITFAPNPRNRPISPIRFAARQTHSSTPYSSNEELSDSDSQDPIDNPEVSLVGGYEEDDEESDEDIQISPRPPSEKKKRRLSQQVTRPIFASGSSKSSAIRQRYMLVRFSTGQILEGDFAISWYSLSPFELLEIHPVDVLIRLPRYSISDYCQPYFRARVRLLRVLEGKLHFHDQNIVEEYGPEVKRAGARQERVLEKLPKTRFEWRERWIIIQGNSLHICKTETAPPHQTLQLNELRALHGPEHLQELESSASVTSPRIICGKFKGTRLPPVNRLKSNKKASSLSRKTSKRSGFHSHSPQASSTNVFGDEIAPSRSKNRFSRSLSTSHHTSTAPVSQKSTHARLTSSVPTPTPAALFERSERDRDPEPSNNGHEDLLDSSGGSSNYSSPVFATAALSSGEGEGWDLPYVPMTGTGGGKKYAVEGIDTVAEDTGEKPSKPVPRVSVLERDHGQWVVLDMYDETAYTCLLRVLHRQASSELNTSFLSTLAPLIGNSIPGASGSHSIFTHTPWRSGSESTSDSASTSVGPSSYYSHRRDSTVELHSQHPASLTVAPAKVLVNTFGARPYPEWRTSVTQRAVDAGWGVVNRATQCLLREEFGGFDDVLGGGRSGVKSIRSSSSSTMTSASTTTFEEEDSSISIEVSSTVEGSEDDSLHRSAGTTIPTLDLSSLNKHPLDRDGDDSEDEKRSVSEWVGWMADLPRQTRVQHQAQVQAQQQTESSTASSPTTATTNIHLRTLPHHKSYSSMQMHGIGPPSPTSSSRLSASPYASWGSRRASIASEMAFSNPTRPGGGFTLGVRPRLLTRQSLEFNRAHTHNASSIVTTVSIGTGGPRRATSVGLVGSPSLHQVWQEGWEPSSSSRPFAIGDSRSRAMARTMGSEVSGPSSGSGARSNMHGLGRSASIGSVPSVRRVKSGSHLAESLSVSKSHVSTVDPSPPTPVNKGKGVARTKSSQKKNKGGIMKGLSMRAEQFVRGLDAALDFVDESRMDTREPSPGEFDGKLKVLPHSFH